MKEPGVRVEVEGRGFPHFDLEIRLTNRLPAPLITYRHALPWVGRTGMIVIAAKTDAVGSTLSADAPIDDPGPETVTLQPGESMAGRIALVERFAGFLEALRGRDLVVFWSYAFTAVDAPPQPRAGGWVLIPRVE